MLTDTLISIPFEKYPVEAALYITMILMRFPRLINRYQYIRRHW